MIRNIIILIIFMNCSSLMVSCIQTYQPSRGEQLVNSILGKTAKIIKANYNLQPCGVGVTMPGGPIREVALCFSTKQPHSKEQLRVLLIEISQELLNQVNKNEEIQQFIKIPLLR